jgi:hypothetical protein
MGWAHFPWGLYRATLRAERRLGFGCGRNSHYAIVPFGKRARASCNIGQRLWSRTTKQAGCFSTKGAGRLLRSTDVPSVPPNVCFRE